jgi:tRNA pseudouridine55 synthase
MDGILVVDKTAGMTSHDVVDSVRRRLGVRRVGHAGTLDPGATGVLVLGIGRATRLLQFLERYDKEYRAEVVFGVETTTQDASGDIVSEADASAIDREAVASALGAFRGEVEQVPPMVSAVKVGGEALYRKARRGEEVPREARRVRIHELVLDAFAPGPRARATLRVRCSKGTYVRTLAHDLGRALGVGGHVASLRRLAVGPFTGTDAVSLDVLSAESLRGMEDAVAAYPRRVVDERDARALAQGRRLQAAGIDGAYAVVGPEGLVAMVEDRDGEMRPICVVGGNPA